MEDMVVNFSRIMKELERYGLQENIVRNSYTMAEQETQPRRSGHLDFLAKMFIRHQDKMIVYISKIIS